LQRDPVENGPLTIGKGELAQFNQRGGCGHGWDKEIADRTSGWIWEGISDNISDAIYDYKIKKGQE
jgi:hypothetical protein